MDCGRMKCMKQDVNDFAHEDAWKREKNKTKIGWMKNQVTVFYRVTINRAKSAEVWGGFYPSK